MPANQIRAKFFMLHYTLVVYARSMGRLIKGDAVMIKEVKKPHQKPNLETFWNEIKDLAEEIYKKRIASQKPGDELSDWLQAEKEIKKKYHL